MQQDYAGRLASGSSQMRGLPMAGDGGRGLQWWVGGERQAGERGGGGVDGEQEGLTEACPVRCSGLQSTMAYDGVRNDC